MLRISVAAVWIGYDTPQPLGAGATGGGYVVLHHEQRFIRGEALLKNADDIRHVVLKRGESGVPVLLDVLGGSDEIARIESSGGIMIRGRVLGVLAVARSIGDHGLKE